MHLEKFWPLILFALIGLIRTLIAKSEESKKDRNSPSGPSMPPPGAGEETDTDRMRKFLEALGQPPGAASPPKVRPRKIPADMRRVFNPLPPITTKPPMQQRAKPTFVPAQSIIAAPADRTSVEVIPENAYEAKLTLNGSDDDSFRRLLSSPNSLRQAFILREVLGSPRGLSPFDYSGSA